MEEDKVYITIEGEKYWFSKTEYKLLNNFMIHRENQEQFDWYELPDKAKNVKE